MSEDHAKVLEQNIVLEEIIKLMLGVNDENEGAGESYYETGNDSGDNIMVDDDISADTCIDNDEYRIQLYQALVDKHLLIPVKPFSSEEDGNSSEEELTVEPITQISSTGEGEDIIAFTSIEKFQSRLGGGPYILCDTGAIFNLVLQGQFEALIINPGVHWVGILAEDIRSFYNIDNE